MLARAEVECYGWIVRTDGSSYSVLVACRGDNAVAGTLADDTVMLRPVNASILAETLVRALPEAQAARLDSITVPAEDLARATSPSTQDRDEEFGSFGASASTVSLDVADLLQVLSRPAIGKGQLFVAVRNAYGKRTASTRPVSRHPHHRCP